MKNIVLTSEKFSEYWPDIDIIIRKLKNVDRIEYGTEILPSIYFQPEEEFN